MTEDEEDEGKEDEVEESLEASDDIRVSMIGAS